MGYKKDGLIIWDYKSDIQEIKWIKINDDIKMTIHGIDSFLDDLEIGVLLVSELDKHQLDNIMKYQLRYLRNTEKNILNEYNKYGMVFK